MQQFSDGWSCVFFIDKEMHSRDILQNAECQMTLKFSD